MRWGVPLDDRIGGEYTDVPSRPICALAAVALVALAGCGLGSGEPPRDAILTVYVSAPQGPGWTRAGSAVVEGAREILAGAGGEAGGVEVRLEVLRTAATRCGLDQVAVAESARRAAEDSTAVAYIGELDPHASETAGAIARQAELVHVSAPPMLPERTRCAVPPAGDAAFYGRDAMRAILAAIDGAEDPLDRESVAAAFEDPFSGA